MKKAVFFFALIFLFSACSRTSNPILSVPGAVSTSVKMECPQVDNHDFPECRAYVYVTNQSDTALTSFSIGNYTIIERGNPGVITGVRRVDNIAEPLSVVICMDRSGSMAWDTTTTPDANAAAKTFIDELGPNDSVEIIDFASSVIVAQEFTSDKTLLKQKIDAGVVGGGTALYDALGRGAKDLKGRSGRKFLVALTDGADTGSSGYPSPEAAADVVNNSGIAAYIIGLGLYIETSILQQIADNTQGRYYNAPTSVQIITQFRQVLYIMQNLVRLDFRSRAGTGLKELSLYLNYGSFAVSTKRKYGS